MKSKRIGFLFVLISITFSMGCAAPPVASRSNYDRESDFSRIKSVIVLPFIENSKDLLRM